MKRFNYLNVYLISISRDIANLLEFTLAVVSRVKVESLKVWERGRQQSWNYIH